MKIKFHPKSRAFRDARRLVKVRDLLFQIGQTLHKQGLRITGYAAGIGLVTYLIGMINPAGRELSWIPQMTKGQAIVFPLLMGSAALIGGGLLKLVPSLISLRLTAIAESHDLNLMEDYRKSRALEYLDALWKGVFRYEAQLEADPEDLKRKRERIIDRRQRLVRMLEENLDEDLKHFLAIDGDQDTEMLADAMCHARPLSEPGLRTYDGFIISSMYALTHHEPQGAEQDEIGFDLGLLEDYFDSAPLHHSDSKLLEQYKGNVILGEVKKIVRLGTLASIAQLPQRMAQKMWFGLVTREISVGVGEAIEKLNKKYETNDFDAQMFLWPGAENQAALDKFPGAREDVITYRKSIIWRVFGHDWADADLMLDRLCLSNFASATKLRLLYDPEYCDGSLEEQLLDDLRAVHCDEKVFSVYEKAAKEDCKRLDAFLDYLKGQRPDLFEPQSKEELRAVKIAFHTNSEGLNDWFMRKNEDSLFHEAQRIIDGAAADKSEFTRCLVTLRMHHELTILEAVEYRELIKALAYEDVGENSSEA